MSNQRLFGTDGVRGRVGEGWMTPASMARLGRAVGRVLAADDPEVPQRALLGHDGRRSGPMLLEAFARGLSATGFESSSAGLFTTPGLALLGRELPFGVTVMVSASHNPAEDNGVKVFDRSGEKLADEVERRIEEVYFASTDEPPAAAAPSTDQGLEEHYLEGLLQAAGKLKLDGMVIALDCANGGGSRVAPRLFGRLGAHVLPVACEPDGENINQDCGSTSPGRLQETVRMQSAHLGIALDGDGDRCILVDERGVLVDGDGILTVCARHAAAQGSLPSKRVVATVMSNRGLHRALSEGGISIETVGVGDRRVVEALRKDGLGLGGEQSGHVVFGRDNGFIGDGLYTALRILAVMRSEERSLGELAGAFQAFPQVLVNVPVQRKPPFADLPEVTSMVAEIEQQLGDDGRVLLRYSGTESLARVMVEGPDADWIRARARDVAGLITRTLG